MKWMGMELSGNGGDLLAKGRCFDESDLIRGRQYVCQKPIDVATEYSHQVRNWVATKKNC
jgi:hypothetical protein